jgi:uncharacterized membrane protein
MTDKAAAPATPQAPDVDADDELVSTNRLEAFSDGVFAIAATLLVLDLATPANAPAGQLLSQLFNRHEVSEYAAYVVSFLIIGITWINHHSVFRQVARVDRRLMLLNLLLLLDLAFLPFPTRVLAEYLTSGGSNAHAAAFFYSAAMAVMAVLYASIWWHVTAAGGRLLKRPMDAATVRRSRLQFSAGVLLYLPSLGLAFISAEWTLALQAGLAVYYALDPLRGSSR